MIKEYASYKDLVDEVAKQIVVDLRYNRLKLKYKIEGSIAPLEIHNDMGMRVYVSLKKEAWEFAKYPICVTVFVNDRDINYRNQYEEDIDMCSINGGSTIDNQALVISAPLVSTELSKSIICNMNHKKVIEDQVYKNKHTLKVVMMKYVIDNRFQWKTERSSVVRYFVFI